MAREPKPAPKRWNWRLFFGITALLFVTASAAMAALKVRRFVTTAPQFELSRDCQNELSIEGLRFASRSKVLHVFSGDFNHSIFLTPLAERRRRLLAIDWVQEASISRIWPDRLMVRIRERKPIAFVF